LDRGDVLPAGHATLLRHGSVLFLEPIAQSLGSLHVLVYASHDAALFARGEGLALEAVDAVVEALLDKVGVHLTQTMSGNPVTTACMCSVRLTFMNSFICFFSMRFCSSRCSEFVSLAHDQYGAVCMVPGYTYESMAIGGNVM
jgi:hypothetical protein